MHGGKAVACYIAGNTVGSPTTPSNSQGGGFGAGGILISSTVTLNVARDSSEQEYGGGVGGGTSDYRPVYMSNCVVSANRAGNAGGIVVAHKFDRRIFAVLMAVGLLVTIAALLGGATSALAQFYLVVFAMGMVNAAVEHIEGLPIGLTYVTGALSRFGRGIGRFLLGERSLDWGIQIVPWLGMICGAICGAVLAATLQSNALWVVAATVFTVAIATFIIPRSLRQRYNQRVKIRRITP